MTTRKADPWNDLSVIDARAPRFNQTVVAVGALVAVWTGWWPILGALGLQLAVSVVFGRQYCLPCVFYFRVVQPRIGEGPLEDSRAPRFANIIGAVFLSSAALAYAAGFPTVGVVLGSIVAALASLAAVTGLCVGCEVYALLARVRGVKGGRIDVIDLAQLGVTSAKDLVVLFTHPLCSDCQTLDAELSAKATPVVHIDVSKRKDLAKKYGVALVPLAYAVTGDGLVTARVH
ncbi:MAG: DUF4395 family protein [Archangium sp.]|nr:DUF4395 family protein [Archangium sp.]